MTTKTAKNEQAAPALKLLVGQKVIEKEMLDYAKAGVTLQERGHVLVCSVLAHVGKHHDVRMVDTVISAFPDMTRKNAIRAWFEAFGPVTFEEDKAVHVKGKKTLLGNAMAKPFWSFKPEAPYEPLDVAAALGSLIKKLEKDQKKVEGRNHAAIINALTKIAPANKVAA